MLSQEITVSIPCLPHVASFINTHYPDGLVMNRKDRYGKFLLNLCTSSVKNKSYELSKEYTASVKVHCSRSIVWRYGSRVFHPETVVKFNDLVDDDMLNELYSRINILKAYQNILEKDIILIFMSDFQISENSTWDKWRKAISRKKQSLKNLSQSVTHIPNLSSAHG